MKTRITSIILRAATVLLMMTALPAAAQNTTDNKNKAIITTTDGSQELNTDDIQVIRFDGGKITFVQPWGDTTFDRTLRTLSFQRPNPGTLRLTVSTSIGSDNSQSGPRRAQGIDGDGNLKSTWEDGDVVYVYTDDAPDNDSPIGTLKPKTYGEKTATLSGDINAEGLSNNQTLYFSTKPRPFDLSTQDGTVESLFYFTATAEVTIDGGNASISNLNFTRPIAVVKFTLKDKGDGTSPVYAKSLTVHDGTNDYVVTLATLSNVLYVGIPGISSQTVNLTATDGLSSYAYERANVTFANNEYYAINVKMINTTDYLTVPLTFEAKEAKATVTFTESASVSISPLEYSTDGTTWSEYTSGTAITLTNAGDKVSFRGNNDTYANSNISSTFSCSDDCYIYGNIMSLINKENFATTTTLTDTYAFAQLFTGNTKICNHATKALLLPATTLSDYCYQYMFSGCTNLTTAPALPATTLASHCYAGMFNNCTGLTTAPALPATTLEYGCYQNMFYGCTSLTTAPALPATTLATLCYHSMFSGCTNLNSVTCLATNISARNCTTNWLSGVANKGTFYKAKTMYDWNHGISGIPDGWTVINIGSISYATTEVNKTTADAAFTNELTLEGDGTVTYAVSSGDDICTVNATTGEVTLNGTTGTCTITATVTDSPSYTYATKTASYTLTVTPAPLSVTASDYSGTYDGTAHGITVTCDGATIKYRTTDSGEYDLTENPTYSAVGTYTVYYQVTRDYYQTVTGSNTVTISKAMLTATAADASRDYGSSNPTFTVNVTGFVNGETAATAASYTAPTASTTATSSSNVGTYAITPSGGSATNYDFTYVNGTLTINKVNPTYTAPTAKTGLTFTGSAQTLINAGSATGGTMYYSLDNLNWYTSVDNIKKTDANTNGYTVYYKVVGDENHNDVASRSINVPIAKANGICTLSPTSSSGWGSISWSNPKIVKFTVNHHGGDLSYVKGGSSEDQGRIGVTHDSNNFTITCTKKISSAVTITVTCAETTNYKAASATYTCDP